MGRTITFAAVSMDGFVADEHDEVGPLFDWYGNGDVPFTFADEERVFSVTETTAEFLRSTTPGIGAMVCGRRLFDITHGWEGRPPSGEHVYVVTHAAPTDWPQVGTAPFTFVTDGVRSAVEQARAFAGERDVSVAAGQIGGQALREGLVDRVVMNLVPAVFGAGRPFFGTGGIAEPLLFGDPQVVRGRRVTHLVFDRV
ncbi:dihydrofolate reductase family protein [Blastococcus sp. SYSU D00669]